jgi:PAS domain S-box-containing protein
MNHPSPDRIIGSVATVVCGVISATVFAGWILHIPELTRLSPGQEAMKFNTCLSLLAAVAVILLLSRRDQSRFISIIAGVICAAGALVATLSLLQTFFGYDFGINEALIRDPYPLNGDPGRMAPNTAVALLGAFVGLAAYAIAGSHVLGRKLPLIGGLIILFLASLSLIGHAANITAGRQWGQTTVMALPTSLALLSLAIGVLGLLHSRQGLRWHMEGRHTKTLLTGLAALITAATLGWEASIRLHESSQTLVIAARSQGLLSALLSSAQDLERGLQQTAVSTEGGTPPTLASIRQRLPSLVQELQAGVSKPEDRQSLARIEAGLVALIAHEEERLALRGQDSTAQIIESRHRAEGERLLASVRAAVQSLQQSKAVTLADLEADANRWRRGSTLVLTLAGLIALVTLSAGLFSLNAEAGQRKAGETRFQGIFNSTLQFIGLLKPDGTVIETNQAALDFIGAKLADVVGRPFWETAWWPASPEDRARVRDAVRRAAAGEAVRYETEHIASDGRRVTIDFSLKPARDSSGKIAYLVPEGRDITAAKEIERALAISEARWNFALNATELGVWDWNAQTNEVFLSDRWATMLGYSPDEIERNLEGWSSRIHPDDAAPTMALINDHFEGRTAAYQSEHRMRAKDGTYRWILDQGKVVTRDSNGKPLRVVGTHADITAQKTAEKQAATLQAQLTSILQFSPNLITMTDLEGRYLLASPNAADALGKSPDEVAGRSFRDLLPPDMAEVFAGRSAKMNATPVPFEVEDVVKTREGNRVFQTQLFPIRDAGGRHVATGGIARDVTDARDALAAAQAALAEREVLLREIHHRVKNNLQTISSLLSLQSRALSDPVQRAPFEDAKRRIMSMSLIHDQLYRKDDLAHIDFAHYVADLIKLQRTTLGPGFDRIITEIDIRIPPVAVAVAVPCGLIINELFANACKHAFPLGRSGTVRLSMTAEGEQWELLVKDDGVGAPAFSAAGGASGLGLQLIKSLVKQLNGTMEESAGEQGRRTLIRFPAPGSNSRPE